MVARRVLLCVLLSFCFACCGRFVVVAAAVFVVVVVGVAVAVAVGIVVVVVVAAAAVVAVAAPVAISVAAASFASFDLLSRLCFTTYHICSWRFISCRCVVQLAWINLVLQLWW